MSKFLNERKIKNEKETYWQSGVWLWNNQNYDYNEASPKWFPKYKKICIFCEKCLEKPQHINF